MSLSVRPITIKAASLLSKQWHRHLKRVGGGLYAVACQDEAGVIRGVAIVGNPARMAQDGWTAEVVRVATDGTRNACSFLLARARRVGQMLGYRRVLTKTKPEEGGASLRAVGAKQLGFTDANASWDRPSRRRAPPEVPGRKVRWDLVGGAR